MTALLLPLKSAWNTLGHHGMRRWIALFLFLAAACNVSGGTNANSRYALLCAMAEEWSFRIDRYVSMTADWSIKDGHYYSNKAPATALLAFPFFKAVDSTLLRAPTREERDRLRGKYRSILLHLLAFTHVAIPFALVALLALAHLAGTGASRASLHWTAAALLLGNLAAVLSSAFFSHGMTALFVLAMALAALKRRPGWLGVAFGMALLSDYLAAALVPAVAYAVLRERSARYLLRFLAGGILPGALWCWYHWQAFGGILSIPHQNLSPEHLTPGSLVWGVLSVPDPGVLLELLFGFQRGILWTQPWIFGAIAAVAASRARTSPCFWIPASALGILLLINASFNGWYAGASPGPRYLSIVFPALTLVLPALLESGPRWGVIALKAAIAYSVVFHVCAMSIYDLPDAGQSMWEFFALKLSVPKPFWGTMLRLVPSALLVTLAAVTAIRRRPAGPSPDGSRRTPLGQPAS